MLVGYSANHADGVYRFLNLKSGKVMMSRNFVWTNKNYGTFREIEPQSVTTSYEFDINKVPTETNHPDNNTNNPTPPPTPPIHEPPSIEEDDVHVHQRAPKIPREIRNLDTSYNNASEIWMDDVTREFGGFALAGEEVLQYPDEPSSFNDAWNHESISEREG